MGHCEVRMQKQGGGVATNYDQQNVEGRRKKEC